MGDVVDMLADKIAEVARLRAVLTDQQHQILQTLGRALGYAGPDDTVATGEHTAGSIADEAAETIERQRAVLVAARAAIYDTIRRPLGVEPDSATEALRLIGEVIGIGGER